MTKLKALSVDTLDGLKSSIKSNLDRYTDGNFDDLAVENGWAVDVDVEIDVELLSGLVGKGENPEQAVKNSMLVWKAIRRLSPNLAAEERIWTRLTHVECIQYSRDRWISTSESEEEQIASIEKHFFARGITGVRDDNALSRLWWNAHVARLAWPDDVEGALRLILKTTDYRLNLVERPVLSSRVPIIAGVLRKLGQESWLGEPLNFRAFMTSLNKLGGGCVFEVLAEREVDVFMTQCIDDARRERERHGYAA